MNRPNLEDVSLIIATYNEEESLSFVLEEAIPMNFGQIIIIDGNSTDKTAAVAAKYPVSFTTQDKSKKGWAHGMKEAIPLATKKYITYMDGDGSYNPKSIYEMKALIKDRDAVFCSRYKGGAKSLDDTPIRALGNKIFTTMVRKRFGCSITDALFFYPMVRAEVLRNLPLTSNDFTLCLELPVRVHQANLRYTEILSIERKRFAGETKVHALIDGVKILRGIFSLPKKG